jgi:hypothetical protein
MKFKEIFRLKKMLEEANIPFQFSENFNGGFHIVYSFEGEEVCSVIEHEFSYGREKDLLEIQGLMTEQEMEEEQDTVLGYLTADNVFVRIKNHWTASKDEIEKREQNKIEQHEDCSTCIYQDGACYPSTTIFDKNKKCKSYIKGKNIQKTGQEENER